MAKVPSQNLVRCKSGKELSGLFGVHGCSPSHASGKPWRITPKSWPQAASSFRRDHLRITHRQISDRSDHVKRFRQEPNGRGDRRRDFTLRVHGKCWFGVNVNLTRAAECPDTWRDSAARGKDDF